MQKKPIWELACVCGKTTLMQASEFVKQQKRGITASCGCMKRATIAAKRTGHGMSKHPAYGVWRSMIDRCRLPTHHAYHNYGARGVTVCAEWQASFGAFWADMGPTYAMGKTLERMDNSLGYAPGNCRWRSSRRQGNNKRTNVLLDTPIGRITVSQAARRYKLGRSTLDWRIKAGWPVMKALGMSTT